MAKNWESTLTEQGTETHHNNIIIKNGVSTYTEMCVKLLTRDNTYILRGLTDHSSPCSLVPGHSAPLVQSASGQSLRSPVPSRTASVAVATHRRLWQQSPAEAKSGAGHILITANLN